LGDFVLLKMTEVVIFFHQIDKNQSLNYTPKYACLKYILISFPASMGRSENVSKQSLQTTVGPFMRRNYCDVVYSGETNRNFYVSIFIL